MNEIQPFSINSVRYPNEEYFHLYSEATKFEEDKRVYRGRIKEPMKMRECSSRFIGTFRKIDDCKMEKIRQLRENGELCPECLSEIEEIFNQ